jgi:hypothetical protein
MNDYFVIIINLSLQTNDVDVYFVALPLYFAGVYLLLKPCYTSKGYLGANTQGKLHLTFERC